MVLARLKISPGRPYLTLLAIPTFDAFYANTMPANLHAIPAKLTALLRHWGPRWSTEMAMARQAIFEAYAALLDTQPPPWRRRR